MESVSKDVPIFDGHIHLQPGEYSSAAEFMKRAEEAGVFGGFIFSLAPYRYRQLPEAKDWNRRLEFILEYTSQTPGCYPFFWIDPTADDAEKQVAAAVEKGIAGFKVICSDFYPEEGMKCYSAIAETGKPLTFHCGGLWSEGISNKYNQPVNFEPLAAVPNLRFALAHFGWPWCDELVALYGKFIYLNRNGNGKFTAQMFLDSTPGASGLYREEAIKKIFFCCAFAGDRCFFGSDAKINRYSPITLGLIKDMDFPIFERLPEIFANVSFPKEVSVFNYENQNDLYDRVFRKNYLNFLLDENKNK
ncbi:MAG: amidohydrolase family protein [Lentisphaeria bacterium]|nr:amidohydrolase family protein [Lentisphaeria bacterium]